MQRMNNSTSPVSTPTTEKPRRGRYPTPKRSTMPPLRLAETPTVPTPKRRRGLPLMAWGAYWLSFLAFSSTVTVLVGGVWVAVQLMYDPKAVAWLQPFLPPWLQIPFASSGPPQTMAEIRAALTSAGQTAGEVVDIKALSSSLTATAEDIKSEEISAVSQPHSHFLLLPVMGPCEATTGSKDACQQIVELRVYQRVRSPQDPDTSVPYYQMTAQLPLSGPAESFAISPIADSSSPRIGSNRPLPLTKIEPFSPSRAPATGIWFNASGQIRQGHINLTYGLALHYNLNTNHLSVMEQWSSPGGNQPYWQEVTGGDHPELVVEQTYTMEPHFLIYQVKPQKFVLNPIILEAISLNQPAADQRVYKDALLLAQEGLWSPAWDLMTSARGQMGNNWLPSAQAQLDLIRFHAQAAKLQAKAAKTPTQQVRTALLDGRWSQALSLFEAHLKAGNDLTSLFNNEIEPLWNRLETALKVNPRLVEARVWGALTIAATESQENADAWLSQQLPLEAKDQERLRSLLDKQQQAMTIADRLKRHRSQIVGTAVVLNQVNPQDWLQPEISQALEIKPNDIWYQVEVAGYHDSQTWRQPPYRDLSLPEVAPINYLWKQLGLHNNPQIQISIPMPDGKEQITTATVKGLQLQGGAIQLLAAGIAPSTDATGKLLFTTTESTLEWLQPTPLTLAQLNQQQPQFSAKILPLLWLELQAAGELSPRQVPNPAQIPKQAENWPVELIDLTGNGQPETIITFPATPNSRRRLLILDDTGNLIYSEFTTASDQSVIGIANVRDGGLPALVVKGITDYTLQRWSSERQRFEF